MVYLHHFCHWGRKIQRFSLACQWLPTKGYWYQSYTSTFFRPPLSVTSPQHTGTAWMISLWQWWDTSFVETGDRNDLGSNACTERSYSYNYNYFYIYYHTTVDSIVLELSVLKICNLYKISDPVVMVQRNVSGNPSDYTKKRIETASGQSFRGPSCLIMTE